MAFIINWLWYKNSGNILTAILVHATANFQGLLQMGQIAKCIETIVLIVFTIIIVSLNRKMFFDKFPPQIGYFGPKTVADHDSSSPLEGAVTATNLNACSGNLSSPVIPGHKDCSNCFQGTFVAIFCSNVIRFLGFLAFQEPLLGI